MKQQVKPKRDGVQAANRIYFDGRSGIKYRMAGEALLLQKNRSGPLGSLGRFLGVLVRLQGTPQ